METHVHIPEQANYQSSGKRKREKGSTTSKLSKQSLGLKNKKNKGYQVKRKRSSTQGDPARTKTSQATSKDKSKIFNNNVQTTKLSVMSDQDSTSKDTVLRPFWNKYTQEWSKKLWSATKTDYVATDLNSLNGSSKRLVQGSWFKVKHQSPIQPENWQTTSLPSPTSLWPVIMDNVQRKIEDEEKEEEEKKETIQMKAHKVRIYPTKDQEKTLCRWLGTTRWTYNQCVEAIRKKAVKANKTALRSFCINKDAFEENKLWLLETPYDLRDEAMADGLKAIRSSKAAKRERFDLK